MYTPLYEKGGGRYILLGPEYTSQSQEESLAKGIVGQIVLIELDYTFTGDVFFLSDKSVIYPVRETAPYSGATIDLALVEGEDYKTIHSGGKLSETVSLSQRLFEDNIFVTNIITMSDNVNATVAIGYEKDTHEPYVLIMGLNEDAVSPDKARELATHLVYAAEASEMDSFLRKALDEAYGDDEMSFTKKEELVDAIRNLREQDKLRKQNEKDAAKEDILENEVAPTGQQETTEQVSS